MAQPRFEVVFVDGSGFEARRIVTAPDAAETVLADAVAAAVRDMIGTPLQPREGAPRPILPRDVLILVQRRSTVFHEIIRALKQAGLPVAGADRLRLGDADLPETRTSTDLAPGVTLEDLQARTGADIQG